jgi:hypothetical protein
LDARPKRPALRHWMTQVGHPMNQNRVDPTEMWALFPTGARVGRRARRGRFVPTSLSEVWTPGQNQHRSVIG